MSYFKKGELRVLNLAWCIMMVVSFVCAIINGTIPQTVEAMFDGAKDSVTTLLSFAGIMCFWNGILKIGEEAGLAEMVKRISAPVMRRLFPDSGEKAREYMAINMSANLLGMGNAATPMGIKAMQELDKENAGNLKASEAMNMFTILNTTGLGLIPSTVIALRSAHMSGSPYDIILPVWLSSVTALMCGIFIIKISRIIKKY